jgi:hypothetical protein
VEGLDVRIGFGFGAGLLKNSEGPGVAYWLAFQVSSVGWPDWEEEALEDIPQIFVVELSTFLGFGD